MHRRGTGDLRGLRGGSLKPTSREHEPSSRTPRFGGVSPEPDFLGTEAEVLERWEKADVFRRSIRDREGSPDFVFYEGPPTANGRPGLHHVWARVYKDLFCRFWTMQGRRVLRRAGWDSHGLPVEVEVERLLGFSGKREIEEYGIAAFVERCRESVYRYVEDWEKLTTRIGYWVDTEHAYWTLSPDYVQSVWWHLRQLWDAGLLFEDQKVVPYCPRCGTALSSHELGQPDVYREVEDVSATVRLALRERGPLGATALAVWTTTPWTLPSNTAVAVHLELYYVVVDGLVVAEARAEEVLGEGALTRASGRLRGEELVGLEYDRPFDVISVPEGASGWRVVAATYVSADEGTGLVHIAPAFGSEDFSIGKAEGLVALNPVGGDGRFDDSAGWLAGRAVREADQDILSDLDARGLLVSSGPHRHSYPHCWRCGTPLIYWGKPSWYIATTERKAELLAANEGVTWRPEHVKHGRFGEWLANNVDWALSRDRYWGTPLPIWRCSEGHALCIASLEELGELAGKDLSALDPHRPVIDAVTFDCPECGALSTRVEAVIDAWFDSGSMPASQWGYPHLAGSRESFSFPADFVAEAVDQTRGWFYSLLAVNVLVHGKAPYKTVLCLGHVVDTEGRKMSKSLGNTIDPWSILETRGADPLRWWMFHQGSPWTSTRTSLEAIDSSTSRTLVTLWNVWSFFSTYASLNGFDPADPAIPPPQERGSLDRWARARLHSTVAIVTEALVDYQPLTAALAIGELIDDLSNWYVRRSRKRFWRTDPSVDPAEVLAAQATLHEALQVISLLLAPFCPFLADRMWLELTGGEAGDSVHLCNWPLTDQAALNPALVEEMDQARRLSSLGRAARAQAGMKVRQPLRRALVALPPGHPSVLADVVREELNVDAVEEVEAVGDVMSFELVPNFRELGPRLGPLVPSVRSALKELDARDVAATLERGKGVTLQLASGPVEIAPSEIEVRVRAKEGFAVSREGTEAVALDLTLDEELSRRGLLRDVLRQVQELRRSSGLAVQDRIVLWLDGLDELSPAGREISRETLAVEVRFGPGSGEGTEIERDDGPPARAWLEVI